MTATDELRRMLDERGVEYEGGERSLRWRDRYGIMMQAFPLANGELGMGVWSCTPEQAIAATLGAGTCHIEERHGDWYCTGCGEMVGTCDMASEFCIDGNAIEMWHFCPNCGRKVVDE